MLCSGCFQLRKLFQTQCWHPAGYGMGTATKMLEYNFKLLRLQGTHLQAMPGTVLVLTIQYGEVVWRAQRVLTLLTLCSGDAGGEAHVHTPHLRTQ